MFDLESAAAEMTRLAAGVRDEQLGSPTPCPQYDVSTLLAHVVGLSEAFRDAAEKDFSGSVDRDPTQEVPVLSDDWRDQLPANLDALVVAWRNPAAFDGQTRAGGVELPASEAHSVASNELTIHGWDLARATDQDYRGPDENAEASAQMMGSVTDPAQRGDIFGPIVAVPDDASPVDRAVGANGRDPGWTPT